MNTRTLKSPSRRHSGQTLVIAIIILAVLLILGVGFAALLGQNIRSARTSRVRTQAEEVADAGIRYVQNNLLYSIQGADWRPERTPLTAVPCSDLSANCTKDRDAVYLRPGSGIMVSPDPSQPALKIPDLGGPDFLGPYSRVNFQRGRVLVRVRYGPSNYAALLRPNGGLQNPGALRSALVIDAVGRPDNTSTDRTDPTQQTSSSVRFQGYANETELRNAVSSMKTLEGETVDNRRLMAVVNLGLTDNARSIWNKDHSSRPAEIGFPTPGSPGPIWANSASPNIKFNGVDVSVPVEIGNRHDMSTVAGLAGGWDGVPGGGGLYCGADLVVNGLTKFSLNKSLGEQVLVAGRIMPANDKASVTISSWNYDSGTDQFSVKDEKGNPGPINIPSSSLDSSSGDFKTHGGLIRDNAGQSDADGYPRGVERREPPSLFATDPQTGVNRYDALSRQSGAVNAQGVNKGEYGYGQGIYIDSPERANRANADDRVKQDPSKSSVNDWLNPNNAKGNWVGPYYIPVAAYLELLPDGFRIVRDARSRQPFWRDPDSGQATGSLTSLRYWVRKVDSQNKTYIVDEWNAPGFDPACSDTAFMSAPGVREFNGVVVSAGDLRVRGVIPTDVQITVVSQGTLYIDGSVTKGLLYRRSDNGAVEMLNRPSRSLAMLGARDYVVLNTTQFFAPAPGQAPQGKSDNTADAPAPIELDQTKSTVSLLAQFLLDPDTVSGPSARNPQNWTPFVTHYQTTTTSPSMKLSSNLLMTLAADDNGPAYASMRVAPQPFGQAGPGPLSYLWPGRYNFLAGTAYTSALYASEATNDADQDFLVPAPGPAPAPWTIPLLGLGHGGRNTFPKFQTVANPVYDASDPSYWQAYSPGERLVKPALNPDNTPKNPNGAYQLAAQDATQFTLDVSDSVNNKASKNLLIARTAVAPYDVRIEASVYAEEGSFFVLPGPAFNSNSDDTRKRFEDDVVALGGNLSAYDYGNGNALAQAQLNRYNKFGNSPEAPFYGEPLDVRVTIVGSLSENMPAPMSQQAAWLRQWGFIPLRNAGTGRPVPDQHAEGLNLSDLVAPNLKITYDPVLASAFAPNDATTPLRYNKNGDLLPPIPRMPVSPTLAYIGEANP